MADKAMRKRWFGWQSRRTENAARLLKSDEFYRPLLLIALLMTLVLLSALAVIYVSFEYRAAFNRQQHLIQQWDEFQVEWGQLLLEESALGANGRVERVAKRELKMSEPKPDNIEIVTYE